MTTARQLDAQRTCHVWADHAWQVERLAATGHHPTRGHYQRYDVRCARCGKTAQETRWVTVPDRPLPVSNHGGDQ